MNYSHRWPLEISYMLQFIYSGMEKKKETLVLWGYYQRQQIRHCNAALHSGFDPFPKLLWLGIYYSWIWKFLRQTSKSSMKMIKCKALRPLQFICRVLSVTIVCCCRDAQEQQSSALETVFQQKELNAQMTLENCQTCSEPWDPHKENAGRVRNTIWGPVYNVTAWVSCSA